MTPRKNDLYTLTGSGDNMDDSIFNAVEPIAPGLSPTSADEDDIYFPLTFQSEDAFELPSDVEGFDGLDEETQSATSSVFSGSSGLFLPLIKATIPGWVWADSDLEMEEINNVEVEEMILPKLRG